MTDPVVIVKKARMPLLGQRASTYHGRCSSRSMADKERKGTGATSRVNTQSSLAISSRKNKSNKDTKKTKSKKQTEKEEKEKQEQGLSIRNVDTISYRIYGNPHGEGFVLESRHVTSADSRSKRKHKGTDVAYSNYIGSEDTKKEASEIGRTLQFP